MDMRFLMKQAQQMQAKLAETQASLRVEGTAGGELVKVTLNGTKILDVDIDTFDRSQIAHPPKGLDRKSGFIGFAGHSDPVAFRNFCVKRL